MIAKVKSTPPLAPSARCQLDGARRGRGYAMIDYKGIPVERDAVVLLSREFA
jgi:hypothetical protein